MLTFGTKRAQVMSLQIGCRDLCEECLPVIVRKMMCIVLHICYICTLLNAGTGMLYFVLCIY